MARLRSATSAAGWGSADRPPSARRSRHFGERIRRLRGSDDRELIDLADAPPATGDEDAPVRFLARWTASFSAAALLLGVDLPLEPAVQPAAYFHWKAPV